MPLVAPDLVRLGIPHALQNRAPVLADPPTYRQVLEAAQWTKNIQAEAGVYAIGNDTGEPPVWRRGIRAPSDIDHYSKQQTRNVKSLLSPSASVCKC